MVPVGLMATTKTTNVTIKSKNEGIYGIAEVELQRIAADDAAARKVDKALEEARGKDTLRTHIHLVAAKAADERAAVRHNDALDLAGSNHAAVTKQLKDQFADLDKKTTSEHKATLKAQDAAFSSLTAVVNDSRETLISTGHENHTELISLSEENHAALTDLLGKNQAEVLRDVDTTRDQTLNGQAVLGEAINKAQKAAQADAEGIVQLVTDNHHGMVSKTDADRVQVLERINAFDAAAKKAFQDIGASVQTVHESLARSQDEDGKTILETLQAQHQATLELIQQVHQDLDTKLKHFREEVADDMEKSATSAGNQNASVRGDLNVVLSLLSDIRKDQIGRPDRR